MFDFKQSHLIVGDRSHHRVVLAIELSIADLAGDHSMVQVQINAKQRPEHR